MAVAGMGYFLAALLAARVFLFARQAPLPSFAPGVSKAAAVKRLKSRFEGDFTEPTPPGGVIDYRRVSQVPLVLAGLLVAVAGTDQIRILGVALVVLGILVFFMAKSTYFVRLGSASGESNALPEAQLN